MSVSIGPLDPSHIEEVARLFHRVWHETQAQYQDPRIASVRDLAFFRRRIEDRAPRTAVALVDGQCAGFTCWTGDKLASLFVDSGFRGLGLGGRLCAEAELQMAKAGFGRFWLHCLERNLGAKTFYEAHGWRAGKLEELLDETPAGMIPVVAWRMVKP
jgi:GNAT superfamily N-acetyltransferase